MDVTVSANSSLRSAEVPPPPVFLFQRVFNMSYNSLKANEKCIEWKDHARLIIKRYRIEKMLIFHSRNSNYTYTSLSLSNAFPSVRFFDHLFSDYFLSWYRCRPLQLLLILFHSGRRLESWAVTVLLGRFRH